MKIFHRLISHYAFKPDWIKTKMVFLAGPRQVGKTFVAKHYLKEHSSSSLYYNWDLPEVADRFHKDPRFFESDARILALKRPTIVFDEIHKRSQWKKDLKGIYDRNIEEMNIIVTGSARLDLLRQSGESLAGRYFLFRILPLGLQELCSDIHFKFEFENFKTIIERLGSIAPKPRECRELLTLGGFPDPLLHGEMAYRRKWALDYRRLVLREDLRDLSRIQEIDRVEKLWSLLPERVGAPLSVKSLQEDLDASHEAVRTWLLNLERLYSIFFLLPYSKKIARAIKKEKKVYLMDWALHNHESKRFENFVISSLFKTMAAWNDTGQGDFELRYVRNAFNQEADFLILKNNIPWIMGDVKLSSETIDSHLIKMAHELGNIPIIQIVSTPNIFKSPTKNSLVISADRLFCLFP